nr:MAG TPA: hypothetical protein [Caudoviricetes sp.]
MSQYICTFALSCVCTFAHWYFSTLVRLEDKTKILEEKKI